MSTDVNPALIERLCRAATASSGGSTVLDVASDPLDGSVWIRLSSAPHATDAQRALADYGLTTVATSDARLHIRGWDSRLLRRRLGVVLAGIDDLKIEWDATAELACHHYDRRAHAGQEPDLADVLADVESTMRRAMPIPHRAPRIDDTDTLLELIAEAEDAYEQLICQHVDYAEQILTTRSALGAA